MKIFLIDLDDTLINTSDYKKKLFKVLSKKLSLKVEVVKDIYDSLKLDGFTADELPLKFVQKLSNIGKISEKVLLDLIYQSVKTIKVNEKVSEFCLTISDKKFIFTEGDKDFQIKKVKTLGLEKYFDGVIFIPDQKADFIVRHIKKNCLEINGDYYNNVEIIDDKDYLFKDLSKYRWIEVINPKVLV